MLSDIARVGWHLVGIPEDDEGPAYVFSVGLYHSLDQPEIMIVGLDIETGWHLINAIGEQMQSGQRFGDLDIVDDIAEGFPLGFRAVDAEYFRSCLGSALWFYQALKFPVLQCLWPDEKSRFPWDSDCDKNCRKSQRLVIFGE